MNRLIYLAYYLSKLDRNKFRDFLKFASKTSGRIKPLLLLDCVYSVFRYNTSLLDYFYFGYYSKDSKERSNWAGTGFMYEYQKVMNPKESRGILEDKIQFNDTYKKYVRRKFATLNQLKESMILTNTFLTNDSGRIVLKYSMGQVGAEVKIVNCNEFNGNTLIEYMENEGFNLVEDFVVQHDKLNDLSPSGLNTLRLFTQLSNGSVDIIGARLRITVNSTVDNMAAGNLAAPVDVKTGRITNCAVYSDITKDDCAVHPITGTKIIGFEIPYWNETINMIKEAALLAPNNKSIGWDIAISNNGPELIEGNHNWCKLLWQLPVHKGLKEVLENYQ